MAIPFTPWPDEFARRYREKGYWLDRPLTDIIENQCENPSVALVDGARSFSYTQLDQLSSNLAASLLDRGVKPGDTALVHLGNNAEFLLPSSHC